MRSLIGYEILLLTTNVMFTTRTFRFPCDQQSVHMYFKILKFEIMCEQYNSTSHDA